jgi:hypothetical protein
MATTIPRAIPTRRVAVLISCSPIGAAARFERGASEPLREVIHNRWAGHFLPEIQS